MISTLGLIEGIRVVFLDAVGFGTCAALLRVFLKETLPKEGWRFDAENFTERWKDFEILRGHTDDETMILENEHIMLTWLMIRFLLAIFDFRVDMGKQTVVDFIK